MKVMSVCRERLLVPGAEKRRARAQLEVRVIASDYGQLPESKQGWMDFLLCLVVKQSFIFTVDSWRDFFKTEI